MTSANGPVSSRLDAMTCTCEYKAFGEGFLRKRGVGAANLAAFAAKSGESETLEIQHINWCGGPGFRCSAQVRAGRGFHYVASIQRRGDIPCVILEGEPELGRVARFWNPLYELVTELFRHARPDRVQDLLLCQPAGHEELNSAFIFTPEGPMPLFEGPGAEKFHLPRLYPRDGAIAASGKSLFYFTDLSGSWRIARAKPIVVTNGRVDRYEFQAPITYLSRINPARNTLVVKSGGCDFLLNVNEVRDVSSATIVGVEESNDRFVGSPWGNGQPFVFTLGRRSGENLVRIIPRNQNELGALVNA